MPRLARQPQQPTEAPKEPTPAQRAARAAGAERLKAAAEARRKARLGPSVTSMKGNVYFTPGKGWQRYDKRLEHD